MRVLVIGNDRESDQGLIGELLGEFGFDNKFLCREEPRQWPDLGRVDLVLSLGSSWSVYWSHIHQEVEAEKSLVRSAVLQGVPVLTICFGAQVLSSSFGGIVERANRPEVGWCDVVAPTSAAALAGRWMQWHYDTFTAPPGFDILATNDTGVQAIRNGRSLGVQFHPEANEAVVTKWMEGDGVAELAALGISPSALLEETRREVSRTTVATRELIEWFLENVAQGSTAHRSGN